MSRSPTQFNFNLGILVYCYNSTALCSILTGALPINFNWSAGSNFTVQFSTPLYLHFHCGGHNLWIHFGCISFHNFLFPKAALTEVQHPLGGWYHLIRKTSCTHLYKAAVCQSSASWSAHPPRRCSFLHAFCSLTILTNYRTSLKEGTPYQCHSSHFYTILDWELSWYYSSLHIERCSLIWLASNCSALQSSTGFCRKFFLFHFRFEHQTRLCGPGKRIGVCLSAVSWMSRTFLASI